MNRFKFVAYTFFMFILTMLFNVSKVEALVDKPVYKLYADESGVRWQYVYMDDATETEKANTRWVEISFFDKPDSVTSVTVPSIASIKTADPSIPAATTYLYLKNYEKSLDIDEEPVESTTDITEISVVNATSVDGIKPMINPEVGTKVILSSTGSIIGDYAFSEEDDDDFEGYKLNVINLDHAIEIGDKAFYKATLKTTNVSFNSLKTIGDGAFMNTNLTQVYINVQNVHYNAFRNCKNLTKVTLGDNVTKINDAAFRDDIVLESINYNNVVYVGNFAFSGCLLYNIDINNTKLEFIGDAAYYKTPAFKRDVIIPEKVTSIGWATFRESGITSVDLKNVKLVGDQSFQDCPNLSNVEFGKTERILYQAFYNDKKITEVSFTDSVYDINTSAFENCSIAKLNLNKVQRIEYRGFANNKLTELVLPKSINVLTSAETFDGNNISKVRVEYDTTTSSSGSLFLTQFGRNDYKNIKELELVAPYSDNEAAVVDSKFNVVHNTSEYVYSGYGDSAKDMDSQYGNATQYKNVVKANYFYNMGSLEKVTIDEGYEWIGEQAFYTRTSPYDAKPIEFILPESLKGIGTMAFYYSLPKGSKINLPEKLEYIGYQTFFKDEGFTNDLDLKELRFIGKRAFQSSGIGDITLNDKLEYIGEQAFFPPLSYEKIDSNTKNFIVDCDIWRIYDDSNYYRDSFFQFFDNHKEYDLIKFTEKAVTPPDVFSQTQGFTYYPFMYMVKAKKVDLSETPWKNIGTSAFQNSTIGEIILPSQTEIIGSHAFEKAEIEKEIYLPNTIKRIEENGFHNAKLTINQIPEKVEYIGNGAFFNTEFHKNPVLPSTLTNIGQSAFNASVYEEPKHFESFTFDCNLPINVTQGQSVHSFLWNRKIDKLILTENVTELPSNTNKMEAEFFGLDIKEAEIRAVKVLPQKAFIHNEKIEKVDMSKNTNLSSIGDYAFNHTTALNKVLLPSNKEQTVNFGYNSFSDTGLKTIGKTNNDSLNINSVNVTTATHVFTDNAKLTSVSVPNEFNNNVIEVSLFSNNPELDNVTIGEKITEIKAYAFENDTKLKRLLLWGNTKIVDTYPTIEIEEKHKEVIINIPKTNLKDTEAVINVKKDGEEVLTEKIEPTKTMMLKRAATVNEVSLGYADEGKIEFETSDNVILTTSESDTGYIVNVNIVDAGDFTVPATTDIYTYSEYNSIDYAKKYEKQRTSELLDTNAEVLHFDEVIYLTSNKPIVKLNNNKTNFDKNSLTVYALRRDGLIMETSSWGSYEGEKYLYEDKSSNVVFDEYDEETTDKYGIVYQAPFKAEEISTNTENFENMTYDIVPDNKVLGTYKIDLHYENTFVEKEVSTPITPKDNIIVNTLDFIQRYFVIFIVSLVALIAGLVYYKKRKIKEA